MARRSPEHLILEELRRELTECKQPKRRQELEVTIVVLLCLIDLKKAIEALQLLIVGRNKS